MLDIQYTLEKLAEYRDLGHRDDAGRFGDSLLNGGRFNRVRQSILALLVALFGR
ncbi:hypothetical protein OMP38_00465 [Cohnella ginsengisoli]|uniref:Uncharacterized protein n=1 Tax=Cohnella ginsengisoli TaxID=425004 RepID=A0A9X4KCF3_9BACL|nr:hypothetical protein [Cohnella ginsengisoli]MDG0789493.1 hypothetical protein [Cohnella ginsengisoli]